MSGRQGRSIFSRISYGMVCLIMAGLQLLSFLSGYVNPARAWFMTLFGLFFLPILLINIFLLLWGLLRHHRTCILPALSVLLAFFMLGRFLQFRQASTPSDDGIRIISYNVGRFLHTKTEAPRKDVADEVMRYLAEQEADIICLQEFYLPKGQEIKKYVHRFFPGWNVDYFVLPGKRGISGNLTISRFPSLSRDAIHFEESANLALHSDFEIGGQRIRIFNCHLESYNISLSHWLRTSDEVTQAEHKMERAITQRPQQVNQVLKAIDSGSLPTIVTGDFNDNPMSYTYNRLVRGRTDAFRQAGRGIGATYRDLWPLLRIDYVLIPERFRAESYAIDRQAEWSDHYPVMTQFQL